MSEVVSNVNIFQILAVGNQELTHSAMVKFLIELVEHNENPESNFLHLFFEKTFDKPYKIALEKSYKIDNQRIRYDLVFLGKGETKNILGIIENKFKATPTIPQLGLYDKQLEYNNLNPEKLLLVFNRNQVPSDVKDYPLNKKDYALNKWKILGYFGEDGLLEKLLHIKNSLFYQLNLPQQVLIEQYIEYLQSINNQIEEYTSSINYVRFSEIEEKETDILTKRDIYFRYLLFIQTKLSEKVSNKIPQLNYISNNDGGKNIIPSIAFWFDKLPESKKGIDKHCYFGIDGDSMKIGFSYPTKGPDNKTYRDTLRETVKTTLETLETLITFENKGSLKSNKIDRTSVYSLFTFRLKSGKIPRESVLDDLVKIIDCFIKAI